MNLRIWEKMIFDLKNILENQKKMIEDKGFYVKVNDRILETKDIELEIQDDEELYGKEGEIPEFNELEEKYDFKEEIKENEEKSKIFGKKSE